MKNIFLYAKADCDSKYAATLSNDLNIPIISSLSDISQDDLYLKLDESGLSLNQGSLSMMGDLTTMLPRIKQGSLQSEMLVKAAKLKNIDYMPCAIDATAGMGEDSIILAAAGFSVKMYEYDPIIAALLQDSINRALAIPELSSIVSRMTVAGHDSIEAMNTMDESVDVIYLDPMFPARNKSGLIKKKFQLLQQLEQPCSDEHDLLSAAISAHPKKIVIKRPLKGPFLADRKPAFSYKGKAIRYDCLINL